MLLSGIFLTTLFAVAAVANVLQERAPTCANVSLALRVLHRLIIMLIISINRTIALAR